MDYQTRKPADALKNFVKCHWTLKSPAEPTPQKQRIVRDSCMEMIFQSGDLYRQYVEGGHVIRQQSFAMSFLLL